MINTSFWNIFLILSWNLYLQIPTHLYTHSVNIGLKFSRTSYWISNILLQAAQSPGSFSVFKPHAIGCLLYLKMAQRFFVTSHVLEFEKFGSYKVQSNSFAGRDFQKLK